MVDERDPKAVGKFQKLFYSGLQRAAADPELVVIVIVLAEKGAVDGQD
jgi:hypothetical protein